MANDLYREMTAIVRDFVDPILAQSLITDSCKSAGTSADSVNVKHIPMIILGLTNETRLLERLPAHEFIQLMNRLVKLSNRMDNADRRHIKTMVRDYIQDREGGPS